MTFMTFGTATTTRDLHQYAQWCRVAEECGFEYLGYGDSQTLWIDPFVSLAVAAQNTRRARIGTMVTNAATRHPAVLASAMSGLQQLSGGRMVCGIGTGDSSLHNIGLTAASRAELEAYCTTLRGLCGGSEVEYRGAKIKMQWGPNPVPIWISAEGPKMLDLAGRIADGVIIGCGLTEEVVRDAVRRVHAGALAAGRDPERIELWWLAKPHLAPSEELGWADLRFSLAATANHHFRAGLEDKFVPPALWEPLRGLRREYASHLHVDYRNPEHNAALVEKHGLTTFLGRRFSICGPAEAITERLREIAGYGARNLIVIQPLGDKIASLRRLSAEVLSRLM